MMLSPARALVRPSAKAAKPRYAVKVFPSPKFGLVTNLELLTDNDMGCAVLDNWFPEQNGIRPRGGAPRYATVHASSAVDSLFSYEVGTVKKFFAATATAIFDITSPATPTTIPAEAVAGLTSGAWVTALIANAGGVWMRAVNGTDTPRTFDGATWATTPAITGVTPSELSYVVTYKHRHYFIRKNTLDIWYLATDAIGGAATLFPLTGVTRLGGSLLFLETWSQDSGDGRDDMFVAVTTEGEVVVYSGSDPASWVLLGVYFIGRPLGAKAHMRAGGDVVAATEDGMIPMSSATTKDAGALSLDSVARAIEPDWKEMVRTRIDVGAWSLLKWPRRNMAIVGLPNSGMVAPIVFVVNLQTGAWARYTGWKVRSLGLFNGQAYYGSTDGGIFTIEAQSNDDGKLYYPLAVLRFNTLGAPGVFKTATMARATFLSSFGFNVKLSVSADYTPAYGAFPNAFDDSGIDLWDAGLWDIALWDSGGFRQQVRTNWQAITGQGFALGPNIQITYGGVTLPDARLISFELAYETGGPFV
jgi:hypothetical protein